MGVIPSRMMPMGVFRKPAPPKPYDAEIEYLESTGTQWIDTGITPQNSMRVHVEMSAALASQAVYFGCYDAGVSDLRNGPQWALKRYYRAIEIGHQRYTRWASTSDAAAIKAALANLATLDFTMPPNANSSSISLDIAGVAYTLASGYNYGSTGLPPGNIALFGGGSSGGIAFLCPSSEELKIGVFRLYSADGALVRDFQPVRVGSGANAMGYLYDRVTGQLFGNAGTGAFVIGPDKSS